MRGAEAQGSNNNPPQSVQIIRNLIQIAVSPGPGNRLRKHRLIVQQVTIGRAGPLHWRRRSRLLRMRGLRRFRLHGRTIRFATAIIRSALVSTATAAPPATAPASPSAPAAATAFTATLPTHVRVGTRDWGALVWDLGAWMLLLLRGAMSATALRLLTMPATALLAMATLLLPVTTPLLVAMPALLLPVPTAALRLTMTTPALLIRRGSAVADLTLRLRAALVSTGGLLGGEFHSEALGQ